MRGEESLRNAIKERGEGNGRAGDAVVTEHLQTGSPATAAPIHFYNCISGHERTRTHTEWGTRWVNCPAKCVFLHFPGEDCGGSGPGAARTAGTITAPRALSRAVAKKLKLTTLVERE